ncbi:flavodoxin family protein [Levilactobacillus humaensis]|uniref:flavodoxin family protein n=1 Tax=Levilactobacillus humaensis TaxID=2950375 RepID=UPI0021C443B4|nr:flavodoxin [Levilactobacillus humaensis]
MVLNKQRVESQDGQIAGQPITAYQLGKTDGAWQHGYGTKSDDRDTNSRNQPTRRLTKEASSIIIYFSRSGSTELVASKIAEQTNADLLEIVVKNPYSGNYQRTLSRANTEREREDFPELDMRVPDLSQYDTIYLGYPIWAMTLSHPMTAFLTANGSQLTHKKIAPFMSEGGYGQGDSVDRIKDILRVSGAQKNQFTAALVVDGNKVDRADKRIASWVTRVQQGYELK